MTNEKGFAKEQQQTKFLKACNYVIKQLKQGKEQLKDIKNFKDTGVSDRLKLNKEKFAGDVQKVLNSVKESLGKLKQTFNESVSKSDLTKSGDKSERVELAEQQFQDLESDLVNTDHAIQEHYHRSDVGTSETRNRSYSEYGEKTSTMSTTEGVGKIFGEEKDIFEAISNSIDKVGAFARNIRSVFFDKEKDPGAVFYSRSEDPDTRLEQVDLQSLGTSQNNEKGF